RSSTLSRSLRISLRSVAMVISQIAPVWEKTRDGCGPFRPRSGEAGDSPPGGVALHAARIGGGTTAATLACSRGQAALRPVGLDLDDVAAAAQLFNGVGRQPALDQEHAGTRFARPERTCEMLGVPGRGVDRLLQVHATMDMTQEELGDPLVLLVA